jgi:predicted ArsR family transcriptional regulator
MGKLQQSQRTPMFSTYRITSKGKQTRSQLLQYIHPSEELTRDQLVKRSGLTYEQVRRQTKNLCIEGVIQSRLESGQRYYRLTPSELLRDRQNFISRSVVSA